MSSRKKILFISCSAGMGHLRAAEALCATCTEKHPECTVEHLDIARYSSLLLKIPATTGYASLVKHLPKIYGALYRVSDSKTRLKILSKLNFLIELNTQKLADYVENYAPDHIVCTHFLVPPALKKYHSTAPIDLLVTDYTAHSLWISPFVNKYFVANQEVKKMLEPEAKNIVVTGLPVSPNFFQEKNIAEIKNKFQIKNDWPTVLMMAGGFGLIDLEKTTEEIAKNFNQINLVTIAGQHNPALYSKLISLSHKDNLKIIPLQFTKEIDEWMRISDVVITKPGGMTTTECLYLQKPMILIDPIPGQEEDNVRYLEKNNFGRQAKTEEELIITLREILNNPNFLEKTQLDPRVNEHIIEEVLKK